MTRVLGSPWGVAGPDSSTGGFDDELIKRGKKMNGGSRFGGVVMLRLTVFVNVALL